jgi:hypothetical protein
MTVLYDPVTHQMFDEAACRVLQAGDGWTLLQVQDSHWVAHRPWTGSTRLLAGEAELALVQEAEFGDRLLTRCAVLSARDSGELEETSAAALLQEHRRVAVTRARDAGFSCSVVLEALRSVDEPIADDELDEDVRVVCLAELVARS